MEKQYWRSLAERENPLELARAAEAEFSESPLQQIECGSSRRGFLKAAGFAFGGAALTGCSRAPIEKAMPYLVHILADKDSSHNFTCRLGVPTRKFHELFANYWPIPWTT